MSHYRVEVFVGAGDFLLANANDVLVFEVGLKVRSPGETSIGYECSPLEGDAVRAELDVSLT